MIKIASVSSHDGFICDGCEKSSSILSIQLPQSKIWLCNKCYNQLSLRTEIQKELHTIVGANNFIDSKLTEWVNREIHSPAFAHFINNAHESIDKALGRIKVLDPEGEW